VKIARFHVSRKSRRIGEIGVSATIHVALTPLAQNGAIPRD
jgi:hypothetical protein